MANQAKQIRDLIKEAERQGWRVSGTKSGYMLFSPDGVTTVSVHLTNSDHRWFDNTIRDMRKGGFKWPPPK